MKGKPELVDLDQLAEEISNGCMLVVPADYGGTSMATARALIRRGAKDLHLVGGPPSGLFADMLIGAGCVSSLDCPGVSLGDFGLAPRFRDAVQSGRISIKDSSCPAFHAGISAAEKGLPFMPMRGLLGSDILANRNDWKVIENPYAEQEDLIVLIPAIVPELVVFHAPLADREGNIWLGKNFEVQAMAHAAKNVLVTFEEFFDGNLLDDPVYAPGTLSYLYVSFYAQQKNGSWPLRLHGQYSADVEHCERYATMAKSQDGFDEYVEKYVLDKKIAAE